MGKVLLQGLQVFSPHDMSKWHTLLASVSNSTFFFCCDIVCFASCLLIAFYTSLSFQGFFRMCMYALVYFCRCHHLVPTTTTAITSKCSICLLDIHPLYHKYNMFNIK